MISGCRRSLRMAVRMLARRTVKMGDRSFGRVEDGLGRKADKSPATVADVLNSKELRELISESIKTALGKIA